MKDGTLRTCYVPVSIVSFGDMLTDIASIRYHTSLAEVPEFLEAPGGAPANVAIAVARLGGNAAFVGKLSDDDLGRRLARMLRENNVVVKGICSDNGAEELCLDLIRSAKVFHYGSINLIVESCREAHLKAIKVAKDAGLLLSYSPNLQLQLWQSSEEACEQIKSIWDKANLIKVSVVELKLLTGSNKTNHKSIKSLWHPNLKLLLVTLGELGCKYYTKKFHGVVKAFRVGTVDPTGAGESFVGALLRKIVDDDSILEDEPRLKEVLKFASACAAISTTKKGAVLGLPTESDALALIKRA